MRGFLTPHQSRKFRNVCIVHSFWAFNHEQVEMFGLLVLDNSDRIHYTLFTYFFSLPPPYRVSIHIRLPTPLYSVVRIYGFPKQVSGRIVRKNRIDAPRYNIFCPTWLWWPTGTCLARIAHLKQSSSIFIGLMTVFFRIMFSGSGIYEDPPRGVCS